MRIQNKTVLGFAVALMVTSAASAQRRSQPATSNEVGVAITLHIAGQRYQFEGKAACQHAPVASIYNVMAEMWRVQQTDGQRTIALTLWHHKTTSGDMFSLSVATGAKSYVVNTVRLSGESAVQGSGKVTLSTSATGGTFAIDAKAADGSTISGTIKCSTFTHTMAEGG